MNLDFSKANILVVGDVMLDSYWQGSTDRISPEAPVPVVHVKDRSWRVGGSGNVAVNVTSLGARASLLSVIGDDADGRTLSSLLSGTTIDNQCLVDAHLPTINKLRVLSQHQQLIRLDFEQPITAFDSQVLMQRYDALLNNVNLVILSDYGKGLLNDPQLFIARAKRAGIPVLVDPKKKDFSAYAGAYLVTPNRKEFEAVAGPWDNVDQLQQKAARVIDECQLQGLLITQGEQGMSLIMKDRPAEHFPAHAKEVYDVTGAGDTVIAALATGLASGMSETDAVHLSCKAAAIVVGRVGTASVTVEDLHNLERQESSKLSPLEQKMVTEESLPALLEPIRRQGRKIVFTNGCFDLLHAGHVSYLEQAANLGDVLIVGVNSDQSVRLLKGEDRPINSLQDRMTLLAALASVDLVVPFSEETPEQLICATRPDILVKGGDYAVEQIAGRQCAGDVVLIDFIDGKSTTSIVKKISQMTDL